MSLEEIALRVQYRMRRETDCAAPPRSPIDNATVLLIKFHYRSLPLVPTESYFPARNIAPIAAIPFQLSAVVPSASCSVPNAKTTPSPIKKPRPARNQHPRNLRNCTPSPRFSSSNGQTLCKRKSNTGRSEQCPGQFKLRILAGKTGQSPHRNYNPHPTNPTSTSTSAPPPSATPRPEPKV